MSHKIMRNAFWLTAGDLVNRLLKGALIIYTTRTLAVTEYGAFSFALNLVSLSFIIADLGVSSVLQKKLSEGKSREYLSSSFFIKIILLALASLLTIIAARVSDPRVAPIAMILIFMTAFDALKSFFLVIHTAQNRMEYVAIASILETAVAVALGLFMLFTMPSAVALAWSYAAGAFVSAFYVIFTVRPEIRDISSSVRKHLVKNIFAACLPLALGGLAWGFMNTTDSLVLGWMKGLEAVAFYNAATKIPQLLGPIGAIIIGATFPSLVATLTQPELHARLFRRINETLFSFTIPIAVGGIIIAHPLIQKLYGANYEPSAFILIFLLLNLIQTAISFFLMQLIFIHDHQKTSLIYISLSWIMNIALCFSLIPHYGMLGAALASLASQSLIFISHTHFVYMHYGLRIFYKELWKPVIAAGVMAMGLFLIKDVSVFFSIPFGATIYAVALFTMKPDILYDFKNIFRGNQISPPQDTPTL